ncbi:MAG: sugar phosphate nucleotidyltransferase [bacterium]|nr:sugar phosphate nucleotidyltransferase [bacterium]
MRYAVILAGGSGTRLWPLSRRHSPKQVQALLDGETLLQKTYRRICQAFPPEAVLISTLAEHVAEVRRQIPELSSPSVLAEPVGRSTAAAIGYAALRLRERDSDALFVTVNSDAYVTDEGAYLRAIRSAMDAAETGRYGGILVGVPPTYPEVGYGYLETDSSATPLNAGEIGIPQRVLRFVEKPDAVTAQQYLASGRHLWNPALFVFRATQLLEQYREHLPEHARALATLVGVHDPAAITRAFLAMPHISIDYGMMEKRTDLAVIPASFGWADVGSWRAVHAILAASPDANVVKGAQLSTQGLGNLVVAPAGKVVALYGLDHCVVIDTPDALLICPRDRAQEVKGIVEELERRGMTECL